MPLADVQSSTSRLLAMIGNVNVTTVERVRAICAQIFALNDRRFAHPVDTRRSLADDDPFQFLEEYWGLGF
jgi:hypothetical protein